METRYYAAERNVQLILSLLKAHGIKKVVASPGATNVSLVASMQHDSYFEMYSVVDERSAAYLACGIAAESGEPVILSCTGATSSRDYMPGLTEAFYRKLPILAITSTMEVSKVGHLYAQATDRSNPPKDCVKGGFLIQTIKDSNDEWDCTIKINKAIALLSIDGGGPVHINLTTRGCSDYSVKELPSIRKIKIISVDDDYPPMPNGRIALFIGSHKKWSQELTVLVDQFCASKNAVAFCDHTSGYKGKFRFLSPLLASQEYGDKSVFNVDLLIHIGEISGDYYTLDSINAKEVWRVNYDGEIRDRFNTLRYVFYMSESCFFKNIGKESVYNDSFLKECMSLDEQLRESIPEIPFSNIWVASKLASKIPANSVVHLGILQSLRSWNFFEVDKSVMTYCNVGGFGIDGNFSTLVGASLCNPKKLFFGVVGDLSFFYDINVIGNRNIGKNIRLMVVNNGKGMEFRTYKHGASIFGDDTDEYIAAARHNGNKSTNLIKHIAEDLGFKYITANDKRSFDLMSKIFIDKDFNESSIIFEIFTNTDEEVEPLRLLRNISKDIMGKTKNEAKKVLKSVIGDKGIKILKSLK